MKKLLLIIALIFCKTGFAQDFKYKEYSYTEFFKLIEEEKDTIFKLNDALIKYNPETDQRFRIYRNPNEIKDTAYVHKNDIVVNKHLELNNIQFTVNYNSPNNYIEGVLLDIHFKKDVQLLNSKSIFLQYCRFDERVNYDLRNCEKIENLNSDNLLSITIQFSNFSELNFHNNCENTNPVSYYIIGNSFKPLKKSRGLALYVRKSDFFVFEDNLISNVGWIFYSISNNSGRFRIRDNVFDSDFIHISKTNFDGQLLWTNNKYTSTLFLELNPFSSGDEIDWNQFKNGIASYNSYVNYTTDKVNQYPVQLSVENNKKLSKKYLDSMRVYNPRTFSEEMSLKSQFYSYFRDRYNTQAANQVYMDLKDLETRRLAIEYKQSPGFRSYFKWKVNQFLKLFSDYGTEPSKAIVVSVYVILAFALIYLFFPNTWDSHGKNRIMNRYRFFTKYMNKDAGMHEVYLEEQQQELLAAEEFKIYMQTAEKTIPKFFVKTAMPIYRWSVSGTRFSAAILKRIDVMRGTWKDLPKSKQVWKSFLLIAFFVIAILYDLFIKILNALMLSINTFTTLGFGEIPIKGLPRYLAIIQGFIGWFMLTIFSVSLISQLLN